MTDDGVPLAPISTLVGDIGLAFAAGCTFAATPCLGGTTFAGFPANECVFLLADTSAYMSEAFRFNSHCS
jgi:hypothetical protein